MSGIRKRLGLVYGPSGSEWHKSHCQNPFAQRLGNDRFRIHFAGRDDRNRSRGGWVEVRWASGALEVIDACKKPSLGLGQLGAFDDSGAMPSCLVDADGRMLLYYTGWTLARTVPFFFFIGLAESRDGGQTFQRVSEAPVLGRNTHDPFLTGAPWVLREKDAFRMWYSSATEWTPGQREGDIPVHYYSIKHAWSADGLAWKTSSDVCLPYQENEHAIARPVVMPFEGGYRMIYSARRLGGTYRVYEARSGDGLRWERSQGPLLDHGTSGWDEQMVCYAAPLDRSQPDILLYNGNAYGRDGFGAALVE